MSWILGRPTPDRSSGHHGLSLPGLRLRAHHLSDELDRVDRSLHVLFPNFFAFGTHNALFRLKWGGWSVDCAQALGDVMVCKHLAGALLSLGQGLEADGLYDVDFASFGVLDHAKRALFKVEVALVEKIK